MTEESKKYFQLNPLFVFGETETPLQNNQKLEKFLNSPQKIQDIIISDENTDKIEKITVTDYKLPLESARKVSLLIRKIFFGEIAVSEFINKITETLNISRELAQKIALDINKEIFHQAAQELREIQRKFQYQKENQKIETTPPANLPVLENEYGEKKDAYLEKITDNNAAQQSLIKGNLINLKNRQQ